MLKKVVNTCSKIAGMNQQSLELLFHNKVLKKAKGIITDPTHVLHSCFDLLPSGRRYRSLVGKKIRTRNSLVFKSIDLLNKR